MNHRPSARTEPHQRPLRLLASVGLAVSFALAAWSQAPSSASALAFQAPGQDKSVSVSKVERKGRAPVSKEILRVKLPKPVEATLANGLAVLILEDHRFPTAHIEFQLQGAGQIYEPAGLPGLAVMTAHMLREGTATRNSREIAEAVDKLGATLSADSAFGSSAAGIAGSGLSENFDRWFALATDILLHPSFPKSELAVLQQRTKVDLRQQRASPRFLADEMFQRAVFRSHPAAVVSATAPSVDAMTPELLAQWHKERYVPQNAVLGIAGDVSAPALVRKLKQWLAGWQRTELKEVLPPRPEPVAGRKVFVVDRPGSVQATIVMGNVGLDRRDPDYIPMVVMNRIFGEGPAARLFLNLREEKGYTYGVYSNFRALKYPGAWRAAGDTRTDVAAGAMTEFLNEINRIRDQKVPAAELDDARRAVVASFALSLEQPSQLLNFAITRKVYDLPADYWDTYPAKIMAVTADDVERVARKYLQPDALQIVAVGDASKLRPVLEKYGPVEVFNTEGKPEAQKATAGQ